MHTPTLKAHQAKVKFDKVRTPLQECPKCHELSTTVGERYPFAWAFTSCLECYNELVNDYLEMRR